jgi:signal transduction histidine kinase
MHLLKILACLLDNAHKFTAENGELGIAVTGNPAIQQVTLTVWDTGIGIQETDLPRLFQPFAQLDARLSRQYEGAGLGLVLAKEFARLIGASVSVESVFGQAAGSQSRCRGPAEPGNQRLKLFGPLQASQV